MDKDVKDHAYGPYIAFVVEYTFPDALWTLEGVERHFPNNIRSTGFSDIAEATNFKDSIFKHE